MPVLGITRILLAGEEGRELGVGKDKSGYLETLRQLLEGIPAAATNQKSGSQHFREELEVKEDFYRDNLPLPPAKSVHDMQ